MQNNILRSIEYIFDINSIEGFSNAANLLCYRNNYIFELASRQSQIIKLILVTNFINILLVNKSTEGELTASFWLDNLPCTKVKPVA